MKTTSKLWLMLIFIVSGYLFSGCPIMGPEPKVDYGPPFNVRVIDQSNNPMDSVAVAAYTYVWDPAGNMLLFETYFTDVNGWVELPGSARNREGYIFQHNYRPLNTVMVPDGVYAIEPFDKQFVELGEVEGRSFYFKDDGVIALDRSGNYRYYLVSDDAVQEAVCLSLYPNNDYDDSMLRGDLLWLALHDKGLMLIDVSVPTVPEILFTFLTPGNHYLIDANDSLVVFYEGYRDKPLSVYRYNDQTMNWRYDIPNVGYAYCKLVGNKIFFGNGDGIYAYDISDPDVRTLIYAERTNRQESFRFVGNTAIAFNQSYNDEGIRGYDFYDISDPTSPTLTETIVLPHYSTLFYSTDHVFTDFNTCCYHCWVMLMERTGSGEAYSETAFLKGYVRNAQLPYVIADNKVWKLVE